tara:strand:+ start:42 stop:1574 length:1533 start_codon:yes stop_codon:yes gene_type:complete
MTGLLRNITLVVLFACFFPILFLGIFDLDEGAFAATSLQMLIDKQYFIPTIGDELRLEKPILSYWTQAISISIFGVNEFALRIPSFLASLVWAISFSSFVKEQDRNFNGSNIFLIFFTLPGIFLMSFAATADAFLNTLITLTLISLYKYSESEKISHLNNAAIFIGFGFLVKGLTIIFLTGTILFLYLFFIGKLKTFLKAILSYKSWGVFFLIITPWTLLIFLRLDIDDFAYLFIGQSFGRFSNTFESHDGPVYYYLIMLPFLILPFFTDFLKGLFSSKFRVNKLDVFFAVWFLFVLLFFSLSDTKLPHYLIYGLTPAVYFIEKYHLKISGKPLSFLALAFQMLIWSSLLALPFYLSYLVQALQTYEVSSNAIDSFINDNVYKTFIGIIALGIILSFFMKYDAVKVKKFAALAFTVILSFKIAPFLHSATQQDIKKLGLYAYNANKEVSMHKVNKPSYAFYANKKSFRGLRPNSLILTRKDKLNEINHPFEIVKESQNYLIIEIKNDENQ